MGGKHNKGCCEASLCTEYCINDGGANCSVESARFYGFSSTGTTFHGTGPSCCDGILPGPVVGGVVDCIALVKNTFESGDCVWLMDECDDCDVMATLVISAGPSAVLTITLGAYTFVYKSTSSYDPLCRSEFRYFAAGSTVPDDCSWPDRYCVTPFEGCCQDNPWPDELEVITHVDGFGDCSCGDDPPASNTLTRVTLLTPPPSPYIYTAISTTSVRYIGIIDIGSCGHFLYVTLECVNDLGVNKLKLSFADDDTSGNCYPATMFAAEGTTSCDPFIFHFTDDDMESFNCCPGSFALSFTVFDPA